MIIRERVRDLIEADTVENELPDDPVQLKLNDSLVDLFMQGKIWICFVPARGNLGYKSIEEPKK